MRRVRRPLVASQSECEKPPKVSALTLLLFWDICSIDVWLWATLKIGVWNFAVFQISPLDIHYLVSHEQGIMDAHSGYLEGLGLTRFVLS